MSEHTTDRTTRFEELHRGPTPLLLANAWDAGSARVLESLGFLALATTSSGHAASTGRLDYAVGREEALAHAVTIVAATGLPVSADLEDCFAADAAGVARTVELAKDAGLAGCSIEDYSAERGSLYDVEEAVERVAAAAQAAHSGRTRLLLTARAENYLRGNPDPVDTIARLRAYERAGADVLYAPGLDRPQDLRALLVAVEAPVNVLLKASTPTVAELGRLGVSRVSVGGAFAFAAYGALVRAASELRDRGTHGYLELAGVGVEAARAAFADRP